MMASNITTPLLGAVHTAVVSQIPDAAAIGAVGLGSLIFTFAFWAFEFLRMGATGLAAQALGAGDLDRIKPTKYPSMIVSACPNTMGRKDCLEHVFLSAYRVGVDMAVANIADSQIFCSTVDMSMPGQELSRDCFPAEALQHDAQLRRHLNQDCVREWGRNLTVATLASIRSNGLTTEIEKYLPTLTASNPAPMFETSRGAIDLAGGSLSLWRDGQKTVLIDSALLPAKTSINTLQLSPDGRLLLVSQITNGSDVALWSFYDLENQRPLADAPLRIRFAHLTWDQESAGVYYTRWPDRSTEETWIQKDLPRKIPVAYHALGTPAGADQVVFESDETIPSMLFGVENSRNGSTLMAYRYFPSLTPMALFRGQKIGGGIQWQRLQSAGDRPLVRSRYIGRINDDLIFLSSAYGSELCLIAQAIAGASRVVVENLAGRVITDAQVIGSHIFVQHLDAGFNVSLRAYDQAGELHLCFCPTHFGLPARGKISPVSGTHQAENLYFSFSAMTNAPLSFRMEIHSWRIHKLANAKPDPEILHQVKSELHYYQAFDGTRVPIQVFTRKDQAVAKFALVYYYGAITISTLSSYSPRFLSVLRMGGMVVIANIRGGGELGEAWSRAGALDKGKTIDDIAAASRWVKRNYTIEGNNVIAEGGSWGGTHTYMTMISYPEDFTAFISLVPVANFSYAFKGLFGWLLPDDVLPPRDKDGNFVDYEASLNAVRKWSPMQNLHRLKLLKPLLTIGAANDERTGSEQNYTMPLAIKNQFGPATPVYLIETGDGGHAGNSLIEELGFMGQQAGLKELG